MAQYMGSCSGARTLYLNQVERKGEAEVLQGLLHVPHKGQRSRRLHAPKVYKILRQPAHAHKHPSWAVGRERGRSLQSLRPKNLK